MLSFVERLSHLCSGEHETVSFYLQSFLNFGDKNTVCFEQVTDQTATVLHFFGLNSFFLATYALLQNNKAPKSLINILLLSDYISQKYPHITERPNPSQAELKQITNAEFQLNCRAVIRN
jgi:hypothetical protein